MLAQIATDAKSNDITAVPKLLRMLALKGTIVTTDALNCQRAIAEQIVEPNPNVHRAPTTDPYECGWKHAEIRGCGHPATGDEAAENVCDKA